VIDREWRWVREDVVFAVHEMQLARHGGLEGIRDRNVIELALSRPKQQSVYSDPPPDSADLAAAYAFGIARNHGFNDGNKRTAWVVARLFLADNAVTLKFGEIEAIQIMLRVASGEATEQELAQWFRQRSSQFI
jgi:death on curing protein